MQLKRILSGLLAVAMIVSLCTFTVSAEDNTEVFEVGVEAVSATPISANANIINAGDTVEVTVKATQNTGVSALRFKVTYDKEVFEPVAESLVASKLTVDTVQFTPTVEFRDGYVYYYVQMVGVSGAYIYTGTDALYTFKLTAKADAHVDSVISAKLYLDEYDCSYYVKGVGTTVVPFAVNAFTANIHTYGEGVVTAPKCSEDGYTTYTCTNADCGKSVVGDVTECPSTPAPAVKENDHPSTCWKLGDYESVVYCADCGEEISRTLVAYTTFAAHTPAAAVQEKYEDSTCYGEGSYDEVVYCAVEECKEELSRTSHVVEVKPHTPAEPVRENVVNPTCDKEGSYDEVVYCSVKECHHEISRVKKTSEKLQHTPATRKDNNVDATCTKEGSYDLVTYCSVCNEVISSEHVTVNKLQHTEATKEENRKDATCTATGSYDLVTYCSVCNTELTRETVELGKVDHTAGEAKNENEVAATCTDKGSYDLVVRCTVCETVLSSEHKETDKLAHTWGETSTVAPTYQAEGYSIHTCSVCNTSEKFDIKEALTYILGDVNADEKVDDADAVYLLYFTLGFEGYELNQAADFNGDGKVDDADAIRLLYHTLFMEDYPLIDMGVAK